MKRVWRNHSPMPIAVHLLNSLIPEIYLNILSVYVTVLNVQLNERMVKRLHESRSTVRRKGICNCHYHAESQLIANKQTNNKQTNTTEPTMFNRINKHNQTLFRGWEITGPSELCMLQSLQ